MNKLLFLIYLFPLVTDASPQFIRLKVLEGDVKRVNVVSFSVDGSYFVTGGEDGTIKIWESENFNKIVTLNGHKNGVNTLAFSSDGKYMASAGNDNKIKLWQTSDWKEIETLKSEGRVKSVIFSMDTVHLITGNEKGELIIWDIFSKKREILQAHKGSINSLLQDKKFFISSGSDRIIKIWEPVTYQEIITLKGFKDFISSISISPNGKFLAISINRSIEFWDLVNFSKTNVLSQHGDIISKTIFSPDGKYLFTSTEPCFGGAGYIRVWEIDNQRMLYVEKISSGISSFDFFSSKGLLVVASGKKLTVFRIKI